MRLSYLSAAIIACLCISCSKSDDATTPVATGPELVVNTNESYQQVVGFGGMYNPFIWTPSNVPTADEMQLMYGSDGLRLNMLRLMIYPDEADWSRDVEGARIAQQHGAIIFASPWYTGFQVDKNRRLSPDNYQGYADHLVAYINYMKAQGINIYAISMQNEPDMTFTKWSSDEVLTFLKGYGAQIRQTGVKLMAPENSRPLPDYYDALLQDDEALAQTDILATHLYYTEGNGDNGLKDNKTRSEYLAARYNGKISHSGKQWWMTEHLFNDGEASAQESDWRFREWDFQLSHLGKEIHLSLLAGCSAYVYWYLKRYYGIIADNSGRNYEADGSATGNGYILSHFVRSAAGKTRVACSSNTDGIDATAYKDANGNTSLVVMNTTTGYQTVTVKGVQASSAQAVFSSSTSRLQSTSAKVTTDGVQLILPAGSITSVTMTR